MSLRDWLVGRNVANSVIRGLCMGLLLLIGSRLLLVPVRAHGISMMPAYTEGQLIFVNRLAYRWSELHRGDIVAVRLPNRDFVLVKRIVALPGETVRIDRGQVLINNAPLEERYVRFHIPWDVEETVLGPHDVYVIGDNRSMPAKNHEFGRINQGQILGRAIF
jgi:signal peptidase I